MKLKITTRCAVQQSLLLLSPQTSREGITVEIYKQAKREN
jgi:hypothetical protein